MSLSKYVSKVKIINHSEEVVFNYLSDFKNLSAYLNESLFERISKQVPQIQIKNIESDNDSCRLNISGLGLAEIRIVKREPFNTIKVESSGKLPITLTFWIQLLPAETNQCKMRLTLHADLGLMIKMLAGNKLEEGINRLADNLASLPYE